MLIEKLPKKGYYNKARMSKLKTQILAIALFFASLLQVIFAVGKVIAGGKLADFEVYYNYSKIFLSGGNLYAQNVPLNYPPSALLFFTPFSLLSQKTAEIVLTTLSIIALLTSLYLLTKPLIKNLSLKLIIMALILQSFPIKFTLGMGQVNLIVLFLIVFSFIKDQENKQIQAGIYWGIASMIKLIPLPLALYFLAKKRYKALFTGLALFIISNLSLIATFPQMSGYFQNILPGLTSSVGKGVSIYDQSLRAFFMRLRLPQNYELSIFIGIILLILAVNKYRKDRHDLTFYSLILAITTITNSFAWQHHFVFLIPGFIVIITSVTYSNNLVKRILVFISYILLSYHFPDPNHPWTANPFLLSHTLFGGLLIITLLLMDNFKKYQR